MQLNIGSGSRLPRFSIVMPSFNRSYIIARAITSVQSQTFADWELLVVDDGSKDDTFSIVQRYAVTDTRIRYHYASNRGLAMARNIGMQMSRGDYVTFLDSDDEYRPDHLTRRAAYLEEHPEVSLLHGGVEVIGPGFVADKFDPTRLIPISECVVGGTFVIRRDLVETMNGFNAIAYGDDNEFFARAEEAGAVIQRINYPTYLYDRTLPDSLCAIVEREGLSGIDRYRAGLDQEIRNTNG